MKLEKILTLGLIGLAGTVGVSSCSKSGQRAPKESTYETKADPVKKYEFSDFGQLKSGLEFSNAVSLTSGDFDGDGDIDIAVVETRSHNITIYENKMPQKGYQKKN